MKPNDLKAVIAFIAFAIAMPVLAGAEQESAGQAQQASPVSAETKADALIKASQNPIAHLISVPFQNNFNFGYGPDEDMQYILKVQPVIPFSLGKEWSLVTRNILPIVYESWPRETAGLGDLDSSFFFVPPPFGDFMIGAGPMFEFPIATNKFLGTQKWSMGPTGVIVYSKGKVVAGALIQNLWSVGGRDIRKDVNEMTLQPFFNYNLPKGWYIATSPLITANWKADKDNCWTVPVGGGIGKLVHIGKLPVNLSLQGYYNVVEPRYESTWNIRFGAALLFPEG